MKNETQAGKLLRMVDEARPLCPDHRDKQHGKPCLACRIEELEKVCRQARACLLNLQPEERNPMQVQMQKMVGELSEALGDFEPYTRGG